MAQEPLVRVTLLKAFHDDPALVVKIPGGQVNYLDSIATHISINPADPAFQQPFNKDENVQAYGRREGPLEAIDLHQDIIYELSMQDGQTDTLVPIGVAKINFGDWDIKPGGRSAVNPRLTYEAERMRVAMRWGGYQLYPFVKMTAQGGAIADTRKIAPPDVPHVRIDLIDQRGNPTGTSIEPWLFYHWQDAVDKQAAAEAASRIRQQGHELQPLQTSVPAGAVMMTPTDIAAVVEAAIASKSKKAVASG